MDPTGETRGYQPEELPTSQKSMLERLHQGNQPPTMVDLQQLISTDITDVGEQIDSALDRDQKKELPTLSERRASLLQLERYALGLISPPNTPISPEERDQRREALRAYLQTRREAYQENLDFLTIIESFDSMVDEKLQTPEEPETVSLPEVPDRLTHSGTDFDSPNVDMYLDSLKRDMRKISWGTATALITAEKTDIIDKPPEGAAYPTEHLESLTAIVDKINSRGPVSVQERQELVDYLQRHKNRATEMDNNIGLLVFHDLLTKLDDYQRPDLFVLPSKYRLTNEHGVVNKEYVVPETDKVITTILEGTGLTTEALLATLTHDPTGETLVSTVQKKLTLDQLSNLFAAEGLDTQANSTDYAKDEPTFVAQRIAVDRACSFFEAPENGEAEQVDISITKGVATAGINDTADTWYTYDRGAIGDSMEKAHPFERRIAQLAKLQEMVDKMQRQRTREKPKPISAINKAHVITYLLTHKSRLEAVGERLAPDKRLQVALRIATVAAFVKIVDAVPAKIVKPQ